MPIYDLHCDPCKRDVAIKCQIIERNQQSCEVCGQLMRVMITTTSAPVRFRAGLYENIARDPIHCETPQDLRDACDRNDGISHYLENSNFKTTAGKGAADWDEKHPKGRYKRKFRKPLSAYRVQGG